MTMSQYTTMSDDKLTAEYTKIQELITGSYQLYQFDAISRNELEEGLARNGEQELQVLKEVLKRMSNGGTYAPTADM